MGLGQKGARNECSENGWVVGSSKYIGQRVVATRRHDRRTYRMRELLVWAVSGSTPKHEWFDYK